MDTRPCPRTAGSPRRTIGAAGDDAEPEALREPGGRSPTRSARSAAAAPSGRGLDRDPWPARATVWLAIAAAVALAGAPMFTNDAFWHVATGRHLVAWFLEHGGFPKVDPFSFTAEDQRWVLHEWLTQVVFHAVHAAAGWTGLRILTAVAAGAAVWLAAGTFARTLHRRGAAAVGALTFLCLAFPRFQTRPTLFSILATWCLVAALLSTDRERGPEAARPPGLGLAAALTALQCAWSNAHSVALIGPLLHAAFCAGLAVEVLVLRRVPARTLRWHLGTLALLVAATFLTPSGAHLWEFALQDKSNVMQYVPDEWGTFSFLRPTAPGQPFVTWLGVVAAIGLVGATWCAAAIVLQRTPPAERAARTLPASRIALLFACFALGLMARRFHWLQAITVLLCLDAWRTLGIRRPSGLRVTVLARAAAALVLLATLAVAGTALRVEGRPLPSALVRSGYWCRAMHPAFDLDGVRFLAETGIEGNVVCHYGSGGILSERLFPGVRVLIDSRIDLYRRGIYLDYVAIRNGRPDQQALLDRYGADVYYRHWALAEPVDRAAWELVFEDEDEAIYLRRGAARTPRNRALSRRGSRASVRGSSSD